MTTDEALAWVDQLNEHMDCGCYDTLTALAAEVRRLREELNKVAPFLAAHGVGGYTMEPAMTAPGVAAVEQFYNTVASTCMECGLLRVHIVNLERDLAAARAEVSMLRSQLRAADDRAQMRNDEADAARAEAARLRVRAGAFEIEAARLREAIQAVLDSPCCMGSTDIDTLLAALRPTSAGPDR